MPFGPFHFHIIVAGSGAGSWVAACVQSKCSRGSEYRSGMRKFSAANPETATLASYNLKAMITPHLSTQFSPYGASVL